MSIRACSKTTTTHSIRRYFATSRRAASGLQGSVGEYRRQLVLFTGRPYDEFPSHLEGVSGLVRRLNDTAKDSKSQLFQYGFAVTNASHPLTKPPSHQWQSNTLRFELPDENQTEEYGAVVYPDNLQLPVAVSQNTLESGQIEGYLSKLTKRRLIDRIDDEIVLDRQAQQSVDVFVCTHGKRDCRCGDLGQLFYDKLVAFLSYYRKGNATDAFQQGNGPIRVHQTTHIGGHKWAATCFTSTGDWYGSLDASDVPQFVSHLEAQMRNSPSNDAIMWSRWRGRIGLTKEAQIQLYEQAVSQLDSETTGKGKAKQRKSIQRGEAVQIPTKQHDGTELSITGYLGETLMDGLKRQELVEATCGGFCECATCYVHVRAGHGAAPLDEPTEEEKDQLDYALFADDDSRLACQIKITENLGEWMKKDGNFVQLPRY